MSSLGKGGLVSEPWWRPAGFLAALGAPLARNGYSLILNTGVTSALGIFYWIVASRLYTAQEVGQATSMLAVLTGLGNIAQLAFSNLLNRFLPAAESRRATMIRQTSVLAIAYAIALALGFVALAPRIAPALHEYLKEPLSILWFVLAAAFWTLFSLQDSVLIGLNRSILIPLKNSLYGLSKLGMLAPLAGTVMLGSGIFAAWTLPLPIFVLIAHRAIANALVSAPGTEPGTSTDASFSVLARFFGWDYAGTLALILAGSASQIAVLNIAGGIASANYNLAYTIAFSVYLIGRSMSTALLSQAAADPGRIRTLAAEAVTHTIIVLAPAVALTIAAAPMIMSIFGPNYVAEGPSILRVLALACLPWSLVSIYLAIVRIEGRLAPIAVLQGTTAIVAVAAGIPLLGWMGALGMAWAWLAAHSIAAVAVVLYATTRNGCGHIVDIGLGVATTFAQLARGLAHTRRARREPQIEPATVQALLLRMQLFNSETSYRLRPIATQSDVELAFIEAEEGGSSLVYKVATSPRGCEAMRRGHDAVRRLNADPRLSGRYFRAPELLVVESANGRWQSIEHVLPGEDGRRLVRDAKSREAALAAAALAIAQVHCATAELRPVDELWLAGWIECPIARLMQITAGSTMTRERRRRALAVFASEQRSFWSGRVERLGVGHGDYFPGNLLYEPALGESGGKLVVSAILDWETVSWNAPEGLDICHFFLTARALALGQELGEVVSDNLQAPLWTADEARVISFLGASGRGVAWASNPRAIRAITCLAWLQHLEANCRKSDSYVRNKLWWGGNVERVLRNFAQR
jgi:O-antigen/teichoic acid export membrane protein